ncbi:metallophosphoesterase [Candidatus Bathyarchaeota archaeon]|nr:metallophosphoesterase [Candidatus Bathyarchaeota archaeon]
MAKTRLFFATDIHGSETCFLKFLNTPKFYKADVLILGGDLTGKMVIPIVERGDGTYEAEFLGRRYVLREGEVEDLERRIRRVGFYPYRTDSEGVRRLRRDDHELEAVSSRLIEERLKRWIGIAEERLKGLEVEVYISGGNDDPPFIDELLRRSDVIVDPEGEVVKVHGRYEMITCAWTNPTPWRTARECSEEELHERLEEMISEVENIKTCIFNTHAPPIDSGLDLCQRLNENLRPVFSGGQPVMFAAGSRAVREAVEEHQPLLGLHGHIHESRGAAKIGRTLCLNPGSEYSEGILRGVIVDLTDGRVRSHLFTAG